MGAQVEVYDQAKMLIRKYGLDGKTLKLAMVSSGYTFSAAHDEFADASAYEISGTGYTAGGATVANVTVNADGSIDADDVAWTAATLTFRRAILYVLGTVGGKVNPVLFSYLYDDTPADKSVTGSTFTHIWALAGVVA